MTTGLLITTAGQAAITADLSGGADLVLTHVAFGDASGVPYPPNASQTALVNERYRATIASVAVVSGAIVIDTVIPADTPDGSSRPSHGFNVAEAGIYSSAGTLIGVARMGNGYKPPPSSGQASIATFRFKLAVANPSAITVVIDPQAQIILGRHVRAPWLTVDGVLNDPPGSPANGATFVIGSAPTGAWTGFAHRIAQWVGVWSLASVPVGHQVVDNSKGRYAGDRWLERTVGGWDSGLTRQIQSGAYNYAVATGTANAWTVAPTPALAAYAAGRLLNIIAPATNTSTTVNANISTLGNRRIKKSDGSDPEIGDLVSGRVYATIDDGTNIRILTPLPSDRLAAPYLGFHGDPVSQSFVTPNQARVASYTGIVNNLPGASHSGGIITLGTTGYYSVTANMAALMPSTSGSYGYTISVSKVDAGGAAIQSIAALPVLVSSVSFPNSLAGSASGIAKLNAGDRVAAFFGHNNPSNQNMSISLDIEFRGS